MSKKPDPINAGRAYMPGFCSYFVSEAVPGALPPGQNSPQKPPFGLYAEQFSGSAFTAPRSSNRHSWLYKKRPSAEHPAYRPYKGGVAWESAPIRGSSVSPNRLRWNPLPAPSTDDDFIDGIFTYA